MKTRARGKVERGGNTATLLLLFLKWKKCRFDINRFNRRKRILFKHFVIIILGKFQFLMTG